MNDEDFLLRAVAWIVRRIGVRTLWYWVLLIILFSTPVYAFSKLYDEVDSKLLSGVVFFAILTAWFLSNAKLKIYFSLPLAGMIGLVVVLTMAGGLGGSMLQATWGLSRQAGGYFMFHRGLQALIEDPARGAILELFSGLDVLLARFMIWGQGVWRGSPPVDPVAVGLAWSTLAWLVAAWAGWVLGRWQRTLVAVLPAVVLLALAVMRSRGEISMLVPSLGVVFLLLTTEGYERSLRRWQLIGLDYSDELRIDIGLSAALITILLMFFAWISPAFTISNLVDFFRELERARQAQVGPAPGDRPAGPAAGDQAAPPDFSTGPGQQGVPTRAPSDPLRSLLVGGLPRSHLLGSGPELSERVVMRVAVDESLVLNPTGESSNIDSAAVPRYYWRLLTYDRYSGHGWASRPTQSQNYGPGEWLASGELLTQVETGQVDGLLNGQRLVSQQVEIVDPEKAGLLLAAGELLRSDQAYQVFWRARPGEAESQSGFPQSLGDLFGAAVVSSSYQAESLLPVPNMAQLRAAGEAYPESIHQRYLDLPTDLPARLRALARDLTATEPTPYDRVKSIETYLRQFPYTLDVDEPPRNRDPVDYFLFDLQEGYCDYYASSMVVLARAAGIPARLAIGYATGSFDPDQGLYIITEAEAHSWPEIYFPGYGWVIFEPTAGRPALERPDGGLGPDLPTAAAPELPFQNWPFNPWRLISGAVMLLGLAVFLGLLWLLFEGWRLRRLAPDAILVALYGRLYREGKRLNLPRQPGQTPREFGNLVKERVGASAAHTLTARLVSPIQKELDEFIEIYNLAAYSPRHPGLPDKRRALRLFNRLRPRLWLARLFHQQ